MSTWDSSTYFYIQSHSLQSVSATLQSKLVLEMILTDKTENWMFILSLMLVGPLKKGQ